MIKKKKKKLRVSNVFTREMFMFSQWDCEENCYYGLLHIEVKRSSFV
jgi:hypothetical protein